MPGSPLIRIFFILIFLVQGNYARAQSEILVRKQAYLMGSVFEISLTGRDSILLNDHINQAIAEISRIENLISEWKPETQVSEVNRLAGIRPVKVDQELLELTQRALEYSKMTDGAFDISIAAMDRIWVFDGSMDEMPSEEAIRNSVSKVGYVHIHIDTVASTIYLEKQGMKIGFGSIGKAYAADKSRELMQKLGVEGGLINASGDIAVWGHPPGKKRWTIGVTSPHKPTKIAKKIRLKDGAVVTSGSYQKYVEFNGVRYSHIIDPRTGYPASELSSVTVSGPSAEFANALSTSIMVLGSRKGRKLMKQFPDYSLLIK